MVIKGKALKRAFETKEAHRLIDDIPLITDETKFITPEIAEKMLRKNNNNRPINWCKVGEYAKAMNSGDWKLHAQGIVFDTNGNILTGQKRLWAVIRCGKGQYFRVSYGNPPDTANYLDRGTPQSNRDLASRATNRKHSITEASIARCILAAKGIVKPNIDKISETIVEYNSELSTIMEQTKGVKKTKQNMMILGAACVTDSLESVMPLFDVYGDNFEKKLAPITIKQCWNRGAAFSMAMEKAVRMVNK